MVFYEVLVVTEEVLMVTEEVLVVTEEVTGGVLIITEGRAC